MKRVSVFLTLLFLTASISLSLAADEKNATSVNPGTQKVAADSNGYIIQPGDIFEISVWKEKDLQKEVVVRPDGKITFPLIGDITAAGLTFSAFQKNITAKLTRYVPNPSITVSSRQPLGNKIFVTGKVNRPGEYTSNRNIDVMQAISLAGGLNPFASESNIRILRRENGELKSIKFNYGKVKKGKNLKQNIILHGGDVVVVY